MDKDEIIEMIELAKEQRIKKLSISNRGITELPEEVGKLNFLRSLDLSYNQISSFPDSFFRLTNLKSLYLNHNDIKKLPAGIGNLKDLQVIDVSNNALETLPGSIGNLVDLTQLDVSYNKIKKLPIELINLTGLKKLYMENNPCEFPPEKVIKRGLYATMHYLFGELRKKESAKIIIQVYNMPRDISQPFLQYLNCFNDLVSSYQNQDIKLDVKFIKQDFTSELDLNLEMESYLFDFLDFVRTGVDSKQPHEMSKDASEIFDVQVVELRSQLKNLHGMLEDKVLDIKELQARIGKLSEIIDKKK